MKYIQELGTVLPLQLFIHEHFNNILGKGKCHKETFRPRCTFHSVSLYKILPSLIFPQQIEGALHHELIELGANLTDDFIRYQSRI